MAHLIKIIIHTDVHCTVLQLVTMVSMTH